MYVNDENIYDEVDMKAEFSRGYWTGGILGGVAGLIIGLLSAYLAGAYL